jgi:hypothetical protein
LEVADLAEPELRQEILKLRRRVEKLAALRRLAVALLQASGKARDLFEKVAHQSGQLDRHNRAVDERGVGTGKKGDDAHDVVRDANMSNRDRQVTLQNVGHDVVLVVAPASRLRLRVEPPLDLGGANQPCRNTVKGDAAAGQGPHKLATPLLIAAFVAA